MPSFSLTKRAMADLMEIGRYTQERWGIEQRNKYLTLIDACFQQLAENPARGKDCCDISKGYRKINVGSHVIFYRQRNKNSIEIVRVLHGRMDIETNLSLPVN